MPGPPPRPMRSAVPAKDRSAPPSVTFVGRHGNAGVSCLSEYDRYTSMTSPAATTTLRLGSPPENVFPRLTPAQMDRFAAHGRLRRVERGEVLLEMGENGRVFVIT